MATRSSPRRTVTCSDSPAFSVRTAADRSSRLRIARPSMLSMRSPTLSPGSSSLSSPKRKLAKVFSARDAASESPSGSKAAANARMRSRSRLSGSMPRVCGPLIRSNSAPASLAISPYVSPRTGNSMRNGCPAEVKRPQISPSLSPRTWRASSRGSSSSSLLCGAITMRLESSSTSSACAPECVSTSPPTGSQPSGGSPTLPSSADTFTSGGAMYAPTLWNISRMPAMPTTCSHRAATGGSASEWCGLRARTLTDTDDRS